MRGGQVVRRTRKTARQAIDTVVDKQPVYIPRRAFLVNGYTSPSRVALVQISEPGRTRGITFKARVRPGVLGASLPAGFPVSVLIRHGQTEVVG